MSGVNLKRCSKGTGGFPHERLHQETHQISGRMFEDEYDLALAVKEGIKKRSYQVGYQLQQWTISGNVDSKNYQVFNL
ncbi:MULTISPECIES: hypothetical protein [Moorena]|nr:MULTISPECIES: hypothetical protein [Moorena]NER91536.1 hypothetical protein [Moorena sp. SIO3A2]